MDAQCVIGRSRIGVGNNGENGFFGENVKGSVNSNAWGTQFSRYVQGVKRVAKLKPGVVQSVMITNSSPAKTAHVQSPVPRNMKADPKKVASIILCGGTGSQLFPLTARRAAPAVPVGGAYRLIDIPMSNCINSRINKIFVLTQFNSAPLNRHINKTYNFGQGVTFGDGFVEVLAATQTSGEAGMNWFRGTADAVRQYTWVLESARNKSIENVVILAGDQLYRMDYMNFVQNHIDRNADITVSCVPVGESRASDFGLMKIDSRGRILQFAEKPKGPELRAMEADTTLIGLSPQEASKKPYIASMGVYVFKTEVLLNLLKTRYPTAHDFGSEIIPSALVDHNVNAYIFRDYWEDIGTIRSFYEANLALTEEIPKFEFYDQTAAIRTAPGFLPPTRMDHCRIVESIVSHGCFLHEGCQIQNSIVGERSRLDYGVELKDTVMMGADEYQTESEIAALLAEGKVPMGIGSNTKIRNCIIDKNAKIGKNVLIMNEEGVQEADRPEEGYYIRSGITVIVEKATIPDGTVI